MNLYFISTQKKKYSCFENIFKKYIYNKWSV